MKTEFWVLVTAKKCQYGPEPKPWERDGAPKASVQKPYAAANQVAVKISMEVPDTYFEKPVISANIIVPEGGESRTEMVAELGEKAAAMLKKEFGLTVNFVGATP